MGVGEESSTLTSAVEKKKVTRVDKEEVVCTNGPTPGHLSSRPEEKEEEEQRLYMLPEQGRQLIIDQIKLRQEESAMQLKEEKTSIEEEPKKKKTTSDLRNQTMTVFQWPQNAPVLESTLPNTSNGISTEMKESSPKPKKRQNNNNNNNKKMTEPVLWHDKKEGKEKKTTRPRSTENNKGPIRTGGWSNPAWKIVQPQPSPALVRAF